MLIYKILRDAEWSLLMQAGKSPGAPVDVADGYVHLSTSAQVRETAAKHFRGETGLWIMAVDTDGIDALKWETSRGGDLFPHLYRELRLSDALWVRRLAPGANGHVFPEGVE